MTTGLTRRDPFELATPFWGFPRLWNDWLTQGTEDGGRMITPAMDISETEDSFAIAAELPGLKKEDVKITIEDNVLTISGEKRVEKEEKKKDFHRVERRYGAFNRSVTLPGGVDPSKADASFKDGVLNVKIPKTEAARPRQLPIK